MNTHLLRTDAYAESRANDPIYDQYASLLKNIGLALPTAAVAGVVAAPDLGTASDFTTAQLDNDYHLGGYAGI